MKPGGIVHVLFTLFLGGWLWHVIRFVFNTYYHPKVDGDEAWKKLGVHLEAIRTILGPGYELEWIATERGWEIYLACRGCKRKNRLVKGFLNATCGQCHGVLVPNVRPTPADARTVN